MRRGTLLMAVSLVLLVAGLVPLIASLAGWGEAHDALTDLGALAERTRTGQRADQEVLAPDDAGLTLALGHALLGEGKVDQSQEAFRQGLRKGDLELSLARVYAGSVAWPSAFLGLVFGLLGLSVGLTWLQLAPAEGPVDHDDAAWSWRGGAMLMAVLGVGALGVAFQASASRLAFGLLTVVALGSTAWLAFVPLRGPLARGLQGVWGRVRLLVAGRIDRELSRLSARQQLALLVGTVAGIFFVIPLIRDYDLRLGLMFLAVTLLFSTLGTLLRGRLDHAGSLRSTLRWLAAAGTLPFLLFFVYVEQDVLLEPLRHGEMISRKALDRLFGYLLVWGVGLWFAMLLSRILSRSILEPIDQVVGTLKRVRAGDFAARTAVDRRDEIGQLGGAVDEMAGALRDRQDRRDTFRRYVDPQVAERLMANDASVMTGREAHATVLFSDVRGFTAMAEKLSPAQIVQVLNAYFGLMDPIVRRWGGVVDKFIGDGMMAVWGVPEPPTEGPHAGVAGEILAVEAGLEMLEALRPFNVRLREQGLPELEIGIGVHAGELIAGPVGSPERLEYTVIGDTVNTSARLEGQARAGASLLVTKTIVDALATRVAYVELPPMSLKGKTEPVRVFHVTGRLA